MTSATITAPASLEKLRGQFTGARCVVVGSAPMDRQYVEEREGDVVVAVNGGISSVAPGRYVDVWFCNSRSGAWDSWGPDRLRLAALMLEQAKGRRIGLIVFLAREDDSPATTTTHLRALSVEWSDAIALVQTERRELEQLSGGRTTDMQAHALSAGMTAACVALVAGAAHVRLEGFSWKAGYQYAPGDRTVKTRGHEHGDKTALPLLEARYGTQLEHRLTPGREAPMSNANAAPQTQTPPKPQGGPTPSTPKPKDEKGFKVRVREGKTVWYGNQRHREGAIVQLRKASHFKPKVHERVDDTTPAKRVRAGDVGRQRDMELAQQVTGGRARAARLQHNAADLVDKTGDGNVELTDDAAID